VVTGLRRSGLRAMRALRRGCLIATTLLGVLCLSVAAGDRDTDSGLFNFWVDYPGSQGGWELQVWLMIRVYPCVRVRVCVCVVGQRTRSGSHNGTTCSKHGPVTPSTQG